MHKEPDIPVDHGGETAGVALAPEIAAFVESGLSVVIGVVGATGRAQTGRALAIRVVAGGRMRLIYSAEGNEAVIATAKTGGPVAVTVSAPMSHRTIQFKGLACTADQLTADDHTSLRQQTEAFGAVLGAIGHSSDFVQAFCDFRSSLLHVLYFRVEAAFEQTPGPGAGRSI